VGQTIPHWPARNGSRIAAPGTIFMTAATLRLVEWLRGGGGARAQDAEGRASAMDVFQLVGARPTRSRLQAAAARGLTRFVGAPPSWIRSARPSSAPTPARDRWWPSWASPVSASPGSCGNSPIRPLPRLAHPREPVGWSYGRANSYLPSSTCSRTISRSRTGNDRGRSPRRSPARSCLDESLEPSLPLPHLARRARRRRAVAAIDPRQRRQKTIDAVKRLIIRECQVSALDGWCSRTSTGSTPRPGAPGRAGGEPARGSTVPARDLSTRIPARVAEPFLLIPSSGSTPRAGQRRGAARRRAWR
jgi:hypothetical protein